MTNCTNCNSEVSNHFCSNCGQAVALKRINKHYISHELLHLLHFEKGFFYTAKGLITKPGDSIKEFITQNRNRHMKPVAFLILTSILFTLTSHLFHTDKIFADKEKLLFGDSSVGDIEHWVQSHLGYSNILMGVFIALCMKLFFRKYKYNIFEITILLCFVMGQGMLLLTIETLFFSLLGTKAYIIILSVISYGYTTWAIGQFFDKKKILSYIKAFVAYILGYLLFYIAIIVVGLTTDVIIKML
jgi:hypothetical protein